MPARRLTEEEVRRYHDDGVVMVKGAIDPNWIALIEEGVERARARPSATGRFMSRKLARYQMDIFMWKRIDEIRDAIYYGPFAHWAQQLTGSSEIRFFYDQIFVKDPGADAPTPWHQDLSFWPIRGDQITSFWVPLDPVTRLSSGLLYVRGSHRWPQRFKALSPDYVSAIIDDRMDDPPDVLAEPGKYDLLDWDMAPGDMLAFHPLTLHGSHGNRHRSQRRRAIALRWVGDDVVYAPAPTRMPIPFRHDSRVGGDLRGPAFPRILPEHDPTERARRRKPERPDVRQLLASSFRNLSAAIRQRARGTPGERFKQTWGD